MTQAPDRPDRPVHKVRPALRRLIPAACRPVLADRVFRRLILGFAVSYLGDGMSFVAVAWLAIELVPEATAGLWVGGAVAAYTLPGVVGVLVLGRRLRRLPPRRLLLADNTVRAVFLGATVALGPSHASCRWPGAGRRPASRETRGSAPVLPLTPGGTADAGLYAGTAADLATRHTTHSQGPAPFAPGAALSG